MAVLRRPGLVISAAVTITVPSLLAGLALAGHEHAAPAAAAGLAATGARAASVPFGGGPPATLPAAPLSATPPAGAAGDSQPAALREAADAGKVTGTRTELFDYSVSAQAGLGMRLLAQSAVAGLAVSYQGVELLAQSGVSGPETMVSDVWHRAGLTVTQTSDAAVFASGQPYVSYDVNNRSPEGVFGVTSTLVGLLGKDYTAIYEGAGSAGGRPALVVELHRADGSLAARFWLDEQTMVPLRREVYDTSAQLISEGAFLQVRFSGLSPAPAVAATAAAPAGSRAAAAPAKLVTELDGQGWRLPAALPGGLPLYAAALTKAGAGQVADLSYSDGLSVISLFVQRGTLAAKPAGWQQVSLLGHQVSVAGHSIIWAGGGFVYTMMADAPPGVVTRVVASLPRQTAPGILGRITRGLQRLAAIVNPFR